MKKASRASREDETIDRGSIVIDISDPVFWCPKNGWTGLATVEDHERELRRYAHALDRANRLLGETADEAKRLQDKIDLLERQIR
jgi:hypothetical protein